MAVLIIGGAALLFFALRGRSSGPGPNDDAKDHGFGAGPSGGVDGGPVGTDLRIYPSTPTRSGVRNPERRVSAVYRSRFTQPDPSTSAPAVRQFGTFR